MYIMVAERRRFGGIVTDAGATDVQI